MRSDEELMAAYIGGDAQAFVELFDRYAAQLRRTLRYQLKRPEDAEDLLQQTFLQLHKSRLDFKPGHALRPWLFTIAINLKREHFRRVRRRPESPLSLDGRRDPAVAGAELQLEAAEQVRYALSRLPDDQREVISLHWLGGVPLPEVAEIVGASLSAVKVRAHRGYTKMREILGDDVGNRGGG